MTMKVVKGSCKVEILYIQPGKPIKKPVKKKVPKEILISLIPFVALLGLSAYVITKRR